MEADVAHVPVGQAEGEEERGWTRGARELAGLGDGRASSGS